jgi:hypothetical protein
MRFYASYRLAQRLTLTMVLLFAMGPPFCAAGEESTSDCRIIPSDGFNLEIIDRISPERLIVRSTSTVHNWFAGTFTDLSVRGETTIGLSMEGNDTRGNPANVSKWVGLRPVMTYADPTNIASYRWYRKETDGRWVVDDPLVPDDARYAGTGETPQQDIIPADLAAQFLSDDGRYWCPWRDIVSAEAVTNLNVFRVRQHFTRPTATIAMRIPYTYTYLQAYLQQLTATRVPGVSVDVIGTTPGGRTLQAIRLEDPTGSVDADDHQTIVVFAREHATEHAGSWVVQGMLAHLLRGDADSLRLRRNNTWLLIPIQDPDGSAQATFDNLTDLYHGDPRSPDLAPEALAYARYFADYCYGGRTIDVVVSLHNVEANECENICCPHADVRNTSLVYEFNRRLFESLGARGYRTGSYDKPWDVSFMTFRLYGWCAYQFDALDFAFEVNDRYPDRRLSLPLLQGIGRVMAAQLAQWCDSPEGQAWHQRARKTLKLKQLERAAYFQQAGYGPEGRTPYDLIIRGF